MLSALQPYGSRECFCSIRLVGAPCRKALTSMWTAAGDKAANLPACSPWGAGCSPVPDLPCTLLLRLALTKRTAHAIRDKASAEVREPPCSVAAHE